MNEEIRRIADECFSVMPDSSELKQFAEMIVQEFTHPLHKEIKRLNSLVDELEEELEDLEMRLWDIKD